MLGMLIGFTSFLIIGLFHPIVIKAEYYFTKKIFPLFILAGILFLIGSVIAANIFLSATFGVLGFTCFWSIKELFEQEKRVEKGWFPKRQK